MKFDKKDSELSTYHIYILQFDLYIVNLENLDLGLVIQEIRVFSESPLKAIKCELVLMKLLYLIFNGTKLSEQDATIVFFAITKTFQSKDVQNNQNY